MHRVARSIVVLIVALLGVIAVAVSYTVTAAVTLTATAIIVPGTGDPDVNNVDNYMENFRDYYMGGTFCDPATNCPDASLIGVNYPASFWPLVIFPGWCEPGTCKRWNESVADGVAGLQAALDATWDINSDEDIVVAGYSQGGAVVSNELRNLAETLSPEQKSQLQVVLIGNIANPDGGLWPRLSPLNFFAELLLDATLGPPMITDSGIAITTVGYEYDPVVYSPLYWGNPFAVLNALVGFDTVHGQYLAGPNRPDAGALPYGYTPDEVTDIVNNGIDNCEEDSNCRLDSDGNKYIMIPARSLPLADAVRGVGASVGLAPIVDPLVDLFEPLVRELVDLGYDWSGDPGVPRPLSLLPFNPFNNWVQVAFDLIAAVGEGVEAFLGNFTGSAPAAPARAPRPAAEVLTVSAPEPIVEKPTAPRVERLVGAEKSVDVEKSTRKLQLVKEDAKLSRTDKLELDPADALIDDGSIADGKATKPLSRSESTPTDPPETTSATTVVTLGGAQHDDAQDPDATTGLPDTEATGTDAGDTDGAAA